MEVVPNSASDYASMFGASCDISDAHIFSGIQEGDVEVDVMRSVRDVDENKRRKWIYPLRFSATQTTWQRGRPYEHSESCSFIGHSPSGKKSVRVMNVKKGGSDKGTTCIEVWEGLELIVRVACKHEKVYPIAQGLGGLSWSKDETKIVYVAEKSSNGAKSFFTAVSKSSDEKQTEKDQHLGEEFEFRNDWGEQLIGSDRLSLFVLDISSREVKEVAGCTSNGTYTPSEPLFSSDATSVIFVTYPHQPKKLGLIYCIQRPCQLRRIPLTTLDTDAENEIDNIESSIETLSSTDDRISFSPRLSHKGDQLVYLSSKGFDTHCGALSMKIISLASNGSLRTTNATTGGDSKEEDTSRITLIDAEKVTVSPVEASTQEVTNLLHGFEFPGFWFPAGLPWKCWGFQDEEIWFNSMWGSSPTSFCLDLSSRKVEPMNPLHLFHDEESSSSKEPTSSVFTSVLVIGALPNQRGCLVKWSTPVNPGGLALIRASVESNSSWNNWFKAPSLGQQAITTTALSNRSRTNIQDRFIWKILSLVPPDSTTGVPIEGILVVPNVNTSSERAASSELSSQNEESPLGLIVVPHGGPHSASSTSFLSSYLFLSEETNCAILHVNYRGSIGFGIPDLESLPGRVGRQDVDDMMLMTNHALSLTAPNEASKPWFDKNRVGVVGGSHGGFLGGHLIGQFGDVFKVAALRNPVINMASMCGISDIPDWCSIEALGIGQYDFESFNPVLPENLKIMFEKSPMAHIDKVKTPTLLALGGKDRRVPCSQGIEYHHILKARGVPTRLLMYPEDCHPIDKPCSEADHWINISIWINKHLENA